MPGGMREAALCPHCLPAGHGRPAPCRVPAGSRRRSTRSCRASSNDPRYDGFRRDWLNIFQVNPRVQMLANNASSDPCAFTLFEYSDLAVHTPPLAEGLTCLDLVRMTLDRYIAGAKGYGQVGYGCTPTDADSSPGKRRGPRWTRCRRC